MRAHIAILVVCVGCGIDTAPPSDDDANAKGHVTAPMHGSVIRGDLTGVALHVAGDYDDATVDLRIQALASPGDLESWSTLATTRADAASHAFAVDLAPVDRMRWPEGGVFRLRVIDADSVPLPVEGDPDGVVALVHASAPPATRQYLVEKPVGSIEETRAYYTAIAAPATLTDFRTKFGFAKGETVAVYYNAGDLGIGREMHCRSALTLIGGEAACYVRNFGAFGGSRDDALAQLEAAGTPLATVAMVYSAPIEDPDAVQFMVYGADGNLVTKAQLDTHGDNTSIPQNCLNCHGGRSSYDAVAHSVSGARFLPFDPAGFDFARRDDLTFPAQEAKFRALDKIMRKASPTAAMGELIDGLFPPTGGPYNAVFVPPSWNESPRDARVYREVIAPYCRSCHSTFQRSGKATDPVTFASADALREYAELVAARVCTTGPKGMPAAESAAHSFYDSSARALLLAWLRQPGACAPPK
jgi:hypothetical protein